MDSSQEYIYNNILKMLLMYNNVELRLFENSLEKKIKN
jgi:hypothetical protein